MRLAVAALALLSGCVPFPARYEDDLPTRRNIETALKGARLDRLTSEEVLLRFGEPDRGSPETFEYVWTKVWVVFLLPPGRLTDVHRLTLSFKDGRVSGARSESIGSCVWGVGPHVNLPMFFP